MSKPLTEAQRAKKREACRKWRAKNKDHIKEYNKQWREDNPDYFKEACKQWRDDNPDYDEQWRKENPDKVKEYYREYRNMPRGRAVYLLCGYNKMDRERDLPQGNLTIEQVEELIQQPCVHCGVSGWQVIGLNRLDNSKPHSIDNVEPCCFPCNARLGDIERETKKKKNGQ